MKYTNILLFYLFSPVMLTAQYQHRLELNTAAGYININDFKNVTSGASMLEHTSYHRGIGFNVSLAYQFELPLLLKLNFSTYRARNPEYNPNLYSSLELLSQLNLNSIDISGEWYFLQSKPYNPYIGIGVIMTNFNVKRSFERHRFTPVPDPNYISVEEILWEYEGINAQFTNFGLIYTLGLKYRFNDRFGINGNVRFVYYNDLEEILLSDTRRTVIFFYRHLFQNF